MALSVEIAARMIDAISKTKSFNVATLLAPDSSIIGYRISSEATPKIYLDLPEDCVRGEGFNVIKDRAKSVVHMEIVDGEYKSPKEKDGLIVVVSLEDMPTRRQQLKRTLM